MTTALDDETIANLRTAETERAAGGRDYSLLEFKRNMLKAIKASRSPSHGPDTLAHATSGMDAQKFLADLSATLTPS
jgi:hypothetical protein